MNKKQIFGYDGMYEITDQGDVISYKKVKPHKMKPFNQNGYKIVCLVKDGKRHNHYVHRLVAMYFLENTKELPQVNHIDGNKANNNVTNLEWCDCSHNIKHAYDNNLRKHHFLGVKGFNHFATRKLQCLFTGKIYTTKEAADWLGVKLNHMYCMLNGKNTNWTNFIII